MRRTLTLAVTDECNAACRYCYVIRKGLCGAMSLETARAAIDCLLDDPRAAAGCDGLNLEFIGGEPLLQAPLIDAAIDYLNLRAFELGHPWFPNLGASVSTNGWLYLTPEAQRLVRHKNLEIMISVDGPEDVHDLERGAGSYARVFEALPTWRRQYPHVFTKATLSPATLPHLCRSVMHILRDLEISGVHANPVFEDVWSPSDAETYEAQLEQLAGAMQAAGIALERCSLFGRLVGQPSRSTSNWCGAGKYMLACDASGDLYPCWRFAPQTMERMPAIVVGNVRSGIDWNALAPFEDLSFAAKSPKACIECPVSGGCAWCTGSDYDEGGSILHRATHICELHKARARVNERLRQAGAFERQA